MTNEQIIKLFCSNTPKECKANNLRIIRHPFGFVLRNYDTDIAMHAPNYKHFRLNTSKFYLENGKTSVTTAKIQNKVRSLAPSYAMSQTYQQGIGFRFTDIY